MDATYMILLIAFFSTSNDVTVSEGSIIIKLKATLSNRLCQQLVQRGNCSQKIPRFYYNNRDHKCRKFMYSGCNGNDNRFFTREQCQATCVICNQRFNPRYPTLCHQNKSAWQIRYFYNIDKNRCQRFWYGGCIEFERNRNIFADEWTCKSLCVRKTHRILEDKRKNSILKRQLKQDAIEILILILHFFIFWQYGLVCLLNFDTSLRYGCKSFDWRPRFFTIKQAQNVKCFGTMLHVENIRNASRRAGEYHIGHISAMFSQPYNSIPSHSDQQLIQMRNIFDEFVVNAYIKSINATQSKMLNVNQNYTSVNDKTSPNGNAKNDFDFIILRAELRQFLQKISRRAAKEDDNVYHFDQFTSALSKKSECDEFDSKLADICNITEWTPQYYYDMKNNKCRIFWSSRCISDSHNNFENTTDCQKRFVIRWPNLRASDNKGFILSSMLRTRCLESILSGNCSKMYIAYNYNRDTQRCEPLVFSECDSNLNQFLRLRQCQAMCHQFRGLSPECSEPLDRGHWCQSISHRYYYNSGTNTCKGFYYTGCGKSRNIFMTQEECNEKCINQANSSFSVPLLEINSSKQIHLDQDVKPTEKQVSRVHQILITDTVSYLKPMINGFNMESVLTRLTSYLCSMESGGICCKQILLTTNGDEKCRTVQPWLKGIHLYSWFFTVDQRPDTINKQVSNKTVAVLIILSPMNCQSICR
ncbi:BMA-MEC-1 [Dirofilaria immitis]|nr:BMA-MEC-1 [Dirofilaria immitis]